MAQNEADMRSLVAEVAAAYFSNVHVVPADIPGVIRQIASSLEDVGGGASAAAQGPASEAGETESQGEAAAVSQAAPAQSRLTSEQISASIMPEALISFEDGKRYKALKRHLTVRGLTPAEYRSKWGLPADYPMVAPDYSARRSQLARSHGLGQIGRQAAQNRAGRRGAAAAAAEAAPATAAPKRGRPRRGEAAPEAPRRRGRPRKPTS